MMYTVEDVFERKNYQYKIVSKVKHESTDGYVYLVARREFGSSEVEYFSVEDGYFDCGYTKADCWLG